MIDILIVIVLHCLYWCAGAVLLMRCVPGVSFVLGRPQWCGAYWLGFLLNTVVAFMVNQFLLVRLAPMILLALSVATLFLTYMIPKRDKTITVVEQKTETPTWSVASVFILGAVAGIFAFAHAQLLWRPIDDFDSFLYQMPFGQLISEGNFPSRFGLGYNSDRTAAYPPLFFFFYGINLIIKWPDVVGLVPKMTLMVANAGICMTAYALVRDRLQLGRIPSLLSLLIVVYVGLQYEIHIQCLTTLFLLLAIYYSWPWLLGERNTDAAGSVIVGALMWSGCCWTNYLGYAIAGIFFGSVISIELICRMMRMPRVVIVRHVVLAGCVVLVATSPHWIRNWIHAENPFYPGFITIFGGVDVTSWTLAIERTLHRSFRWLDLLEYFDRASISESSVVLAAITSLLFVRSVATRQRLILYMFLVGFMIFWVTFLQISLNPTSRLLLPIKLVAVISVTAQVFEALRDRSWYMALGLAHLPCFAVWIFVPEITPMWFVVFLGVVLIAVPVVSAIAPRDSGLPIVIHRLWVLATSFVFLCAVVPASWLIPNLWEILVLPLLIAGVVVLISYGCKSIVSKPNHALLCTGTVCVVMVVTFVTNAEPKNVNRFVLDILPDIKWMNANLPTDALVVTTENRLWFLQRNSMAADDYRLEKFYRLTSPEASVGQLRAIGITHAYRSHRTSAFFRLFKRKEILWPAESNPHVRKIYESDSGVVVQIVSDNNVDSGGSGNP